MELRIDNLFLPYALFIGCRLASNLLHSLNKILEGGDYFSFSPVIVIVFHQGTWNFNFEKFGFGIENSCDSAIETEFFDDPYRNRGLKMSRFRSPGQFVMLEI